jgi:hypothetical protein
MTEMRWQGILGDVNDMSSSVAFPVAYLNFSVGTQAQCAICHTDKNCCSDG